VYSGGSLKCTLRLGSIRDVLEISIRKSDEQLFSQMERVQNAQATSMEMVSMNLRRHIGSGELMELTFLFILSCPVKESGL
jgi:hypothetical protein